MGLGLLARRALLSAALAIVALSPASAQTAPSADDMVIGAANAPVTLLEYGSAMCGHCRAFEAASWDTLKREYIDAGRVRFVFREMFAPTSPDGTIQSITFSMYQVARCGAAPPELYFERLGALFDRQPQIFRAASGREIRSIIFAVGLETGLTQEQALACIGDPAGIARIQRIEQLAVHDGISGTPTFFLDGRRVETEPLMTPDGLRRVLDAAVAARRR